MGDFNGDGDLDYLPRDVGGTDPIAVYENNGDGSFTRKTSFLSNGISTFRAADLDRDEDLDIARVLENGGNYSVQTYFNDGTGNFSLNSNYPFASRITDLCIADFNGDGAPDIVVVGNPSPTPNKILINSGTGGFGMYASPLPIMKFPVAADINGDGKIDIIGRDGLGTFIHGAINSGTGVFTTSTIITSGMFSVNESSSIGDINNDGTLDVVVSSSMDGFQVYANNGNGNYSIIGGTYSAVGTTATALVDLDNDGDLDVLVALSGAPSQWWLNNGAGTFTYGGATVATKSTFAVAAGDLDNDGDADYIEGNNGQTNDYYLSDQAATSPNTQPSAPSSGFNASLITSGSGLAFVRLTWGSGSDTETPTTMLQYQPRVGTGSAGNNIVSGRTASPNYVSRLMPNGQSRTMTLRNLTCGQTYYWNVATVDTGFRQSPWSTEQSFTLDGACALTINGGGGGGSPPPVESGGGGGTALFRQAAPLNVEPEVPAEGTVAVAVFRDSNGDGKRSRKEVATGFEGVVIHVTGTGQDGAAVDRSGTIGKNGTVRISVPPSGDGGYAVTMEESALLSGLTVSVPMEEVEVGSGQETQVTLGFKKTVLIGTRQCVTIGEGEGAGTSDAEKLFSLLEDAFGRRTAEGVKLDSVLMTRRAFLQALARTQCLPLLSGTELTGKSGRKLKDLGVSPLTQDAMLIYSLMADGLPVERETPGGLYGDLDAPITRGEAVRIVATVLKVDNTQDDGTGSPVPEDVRGMFKGPYLGLKNLTVLPRSFGATLDPKSGLTQEEGLTLVLRAAFSSGKIGLVPPSLDSTGTLTKSTETFMTLLPEISTRSCLTEDAEREAHVMFTDLQPGKKLFADASRLLRYGTVNADGKTLWLLTGTDGMTEFGVVMGEAVLKAGKTVTVAELLRTLEVLRCRPPETAKTVATELLSGETQRTAGTGDRRTGRDAISGLSRGAGLVERVMFASQDRETLYNLSLLSYAPEIVKGVIRDPGTEISVEEGSAMMASALLGIGLQEGVINAQEAENLASSLKEAIGKALLPGSNPEGRKQPLTRAMLVEFLSTVVNGKVEDSEEVPTRLPVAELWWERVR
jgi:hypothetical protein